MTEGNPNWMAVYDATRFRRIYGFFLMPLVITFLIAGILLVHFAPESQDSTLALALGVLFALGGGYGVVYTAVTLNRVPSTFAYYLGRTRWHCFWFNGDGVWRDRRFVSPWSEVSDVELIRVWRERRYMGRLQVVVTVHGTVRITLNSGRVVEVEDVLNPEEVLRLMRESYLRK